MAPRKKVLSGIAAALVTTAGTVITIFLLGNEIMTSQVIVTFAGWILFFAGTLMTSKKKP